MPDFPEVLSTLGYVLLSLLLWRFFKHRLWRRYPFFSLYLLPMSIRAYSLIFLESWMSPDGYAHFYWTTSSTSSVLRLLIAWEIVRQLFPRNHTLGSAARSGSLLLLLTAFLAFTLMGPQGSIHTDLERKMALTDGAWAALVVAAAWFYGVRIARPVWSLAVGLGLYTSVSLVNFSIFELFPSLQAFFSIIRQFDFSIVMAIWLWGFWNPPQKSALPPPSVDQESLADWRRRWGQVRQSVRSVWK